MTAYDHEYQFARDEGIEFRFLTQPVQVLHEDGVVTGLRCVRMELGEPDASGRRAPRPVSDSQHVVPCDVVVSAIGQERPGPAQAWDLDLDGGYIRTDSDLATSIPGVWAAGDAVRARGAAGTVMAVQDGKKVARAIDAALTTNAVTVSGGHHRCT